MSASSSPAVAADDLSAAAAAGSVSADATLQLSPRGLRVSRRELLLLLSSTLASLGCVDTVRQLKAETGVTHRQQTAEDIADSIRGGDWSAAQQRLEAVKQLPAVLRLRLQLLLLCQRYMEMLESAMMAQQADGAAAALLFLQRSIQPACSALDRRAAARARPRGQQGRQRQRKGQRAVEQAAVSLPASLSAMSWPAVCAACLSQSEADRPSASIVGRLACCLLLQSLPQLYSSTQWEGQKGGSRQRVAELVLSCLPQSSSVPPSRLLSLLDCALQHQIQHCLLHSRQAAGAAGSSASTSLLQPHACHIAVSASCLSVLSAHSDEVLFLCFSPCRTLLASVSRDTTCCIWSRQQSQQQPHSSAAAAAFSLRTVLRGHAACLWHCSWSSDSSLLLCCGASTEVSLWDARSGSLLLLCESGHRDDVHAAAFVEQDAAFVTACCPDRLLIMRDLQGTELRRFSLDLLSDFQLTACRRYAVTITRSRRIEAIDLRTQAKVSLPLAAAPTTAASSSSSSSSQQQQHMPHTAPASGAASAPAASAASSSSSPSAASSSSSSASASAAASNATAASAFASCLALSDDDSTALITSINPAQLQSFSLAPLFAALRAQSSSSAPAASPLSQPQSAASSTASAFPPAAAAAASSSPLPMLSCVGGFVQARYVLHPCFLDAAKEMAAVGSEDCTLRVFHLPSSTAVAALRGHTGNVNCVQTDIGSGVMATASDDFTVRIWRIPTVQSADCGRHERR